MSHFLQDKVLILKSCLPGPHELTSTYLNSLTYKGRESPPFPQTLSSLDHQTHLPFPEAFPSSKKLLILQTSNESSQFQINHPNVNMTSQVFLSLRPTVSHDPRSVTSYHTVFDDTSSSLNNKLPNDNHVCFVHCYVLSANMIPSIR